MLTFETFAIHQLKLHKFIIVIELKEGIQFYGNCFHLGAIILILLLIIKEINLNHLNFNIKTKCLIKCQDYV